MRIRTIQQIAGLLLGGLLLLQVTGLDTLAFSALKSSPGKQCTMLCCVQKDHCQCQKNTPGVFFTRCSVKFPAFNISFTDNLLPPANSISTQTPPTIDHLPIIRFIPMAFQDWRNIPENPPEVGYTISPIGS